MQRRVDGLIVRATHSPRSETQPPVSVPTPPTNPKRRIIRRRIGLILLSLSSILLCLILINFNKLSIAWYSTKNGVSSLSAGTETLLATPRRAGEHFRTAAKDFSTAVSNLKKMDPLTKTLFLLPGTSDTLQLLKVGEEASAVGSSIAKLFLKPPPKIAGDFITTVGQSTAWLRDWAEENNQELSNLEKHLTTLSQVSERVNSGLLPAQSTRQLAAWQRKLPDVSQSYTAVRQILTETDSLTGSKETQRYMILFQNNSELRPTGGFIGSYATLELKGEAAPNFWVMTNIWHATPQGNWTPIESPYPVNELDKQLRVFNANWDPDFPRSAALLLRFYEAIHSTPAQGVIAIDTSLITDILTITGPVDFPAYQTKLDASNFLEVVQYKVEKEYFESDTNKEENQPKKILADFIPVLFSRMAKLSPDEQSKMIEMLGQSAARRTIQVYSTNQNVQSALVKLGLAGELKTTDSDFLHINNANLGGGKSSLNIKEDVELNQRAISGVIENTLTITRTHTGNGHWPDKDNHNYMRIFVPEGSKLVSSSENFESPKVTTDNGRTVIGGWFRTPVAEKRQVKIVYTLPPSVDAKNYSLLWQRQSGENPLNAKVSSPLLGQRELMLISDQLLTRP